MIYIHMPLLDFVGFLDRASERQRLEAFEFLFSVFERDATCVVCPEEVMSW